MVNILPNKMNYVAYVGMNTMPVYIFHLIVRYLVKKYTIFFGVLPKNWVVYYVMIFALAGLCVFVFSSKPVVKAYDFVVEGLWKVFLWILDRCVDVLALLHKPVAAVTQKVLDGIGGIAGNGGLDEAASAGEAASTDDSASTDEAANTAGSASTDDPANTAKKDAI